MPKLIDADKLKEHYAWWDNEDKKIFDTIIDLQPEAVVRCKDCIYREVHVDLVYRYEICGIRNEIINLEGFCHMGKRREDETN